MAIIVKTTKQFAIALIKIYQIAMSPIIGPVCRFYPSCSNYGIQAITQHGLSKGLILILFRLLKCHPWHRGGHDPVPTTFKLK